MRLDLDFREFVESFVAHDVRFLLVGGYAVAAHGLPRATGDFDAWERRLPIVLDGIELNVIGREDLIANKRAAGRPQDRADVARLTRHTRSK